MPRLWRYKHHDERPQVPEWLRLQRLWSRIMRNTEVLTMSEEREIITYCENCGKPIYEDEATVTSQGLICHDVCPSEKEDTMQCNKCFKHLKEGARIWECTVGEVEIDLDGEAFFEPSETTEHYCPECMGEEEE